jgi:hypothetical protein
MPLQVRVKGVSISTATNWAFNWLVGEMTPVLQENIKWRLYPLHGFFCCLSFIVVYFCELLHIRRDQYNQLIVHVSTVFPETSGIPLEEM